MFFVICDQLTLVSVVRLSCMCSSTVAKLAAWGKGPIEPPPWSLPAHQQGIEVLGTLVCTYEYVAEFGKQVIVMKCSYLSKSLSSLRYRLLGWVCPFALYPR